MTRRPTPPAVVGEVLETLLQRLDPEQELRAYRVWSIWAQEVGATIARRAQPSHVRNGVLVVTVATHAWLQELQFMKDTLRERLNTRLGAPVIRDILLVAGKVEVPAEAAPAPEEPPEPPPVVPALPALDDPALTSVFTRIVVAQARRARAAGAPPASAKPRRRR